MFQVKIDTKKNRLYLFLGEIEEKKEFSNVICETERLVRFLKQGFSCISDLRGFTFRDPDHDFMQCVQETLWDTGVKLVVRIVDESSIKVFSHEKKSVTWPAYKLKTVLSMDEAEQFLEEKNL